MVKDDLKTKIYLAYLLHLKECYQPYVDMEKKDFDALARDLYNRTYDKGRYFKLYDFHNLLIETFIKYKRIHRDRKYFNYTDINNLDRFISKVEEAPIEINANSFKMFRRKYICQNIANA